MTANKLSFAMLLRISRTSTSHTAANQITLAVSTSRAIIWISIRSALARLKERSSSASLRLTTIGERIIADRTRTFIRAGNTIVEEGLVAACDYRTGAGAGDGDGVALDIADVYEGSVDAVKGVEAGFDKGASANNSRVGVFADGNAAGPVGWVDTLSSGLGGNLVIGKDSMQE